MAVKDFLTKIPLDVVFQILSKLPTKTLLNLRLVSRHFNPLILHFHFLKLQIAAAGGGGGGGDSHRLVYYESTDSTKAYFSFLAGKTLSLCKTLKTPLKSNNGFLRIVGSSKGLVCLFDTNYFTFVGGLILWNPFIGKFKNLPFPSKLISKVTNPAHMVVGFGFDHTSLDFKVIKILYECVSDHHYLPKALIFSVKSGSWYEIDLKVPCFLPITWSSSVFVNGVVHWLAYTWEMLDNGSPNRVMGFDVVREAFVSMDLPRNLKENVRDMRLSHLVDRRTLALFVSYHDNRGDGWDIWFMNDYGDGESWILHRAFVFDQVFSPLRILNDSEILASISDENLILIDMDKGYYSNLDVRGSPSSFCAYDYMPTLAMLDTGDQLRWSS